MAIYLLTTDAQYKRVFKERIAAHYVDNYYQVDDNTWLIASGETSQKVAETLDISEGQLGTFLIVALSTYWGWHNKDVWEWIELNSKG